ncbi:uncharacterized protein CcaverHIS019_0503010 [Cutaneotrichosporon cavernicola]|uniref:Uncharacterized protein n=1 Tax=Cutaneotrichosporon cavernicola TaxID=279322 RepID=A0AA48QWS8_9TREE|nr:uncharacterized protein CcaverHIS019_0503010 [Cutaneotrichosporon cavernicola]BEI92673.1 hypothetical protein CcaverHIS019_0503010 [Cutaneotrichosporon cavernicola]BEJ00448.1 hypothetical protein CcaverHIS631_0503050 [Cutaneotrichosporon cavernicola]BEJ08217.1 hypothetical protein CcaverHIS641_0503020 [Cutaneotrichosporon cavernicola]
MSTSPAPKSRRPSITALFANSFSSASSASPSHTPSTTPPCDVSPLSISPLNPASPPSRKMHRSYSQSHVRTASYLMSSPANLPTLGQGATVVRTPSDATMFMAQPGAQAPWPMARQASLRARPRRPSEGGPLPGGFAPPITSDPAPVLPPLQVTSLSSDLRDTFTVTEHVQCNGRQPIGSLTRSPSAPHQSRAAVDTSTGYTPGRRATHRPSNGGLHASASLSRIPGRGPSPNHITTPTAMLLERSSSARSTKATASCPSPRTSPMAAESRPCPTLCREPSCTRLNTSTHIHHHRPSNASEDTLTTPRARTITPPSPGLMTPPAESPPPILVSHSVRQTNEAGSVVLVTLRFGFSLDAEPNTHSVTITLDTLRPAGGRLLEFLDKVLHPTPSQSPPVHLISRDSGIGESGTGTPLVTDSSPEPSLEMTDGSSAEDSDFEYDNMRLHPNLMDECVVAQTLAAVPKMPADAPPRPARRQYPPTSYPYPALPPLADLPAALAQAKAAVEANAAAEKHLTGRRRASTCPSLTMGVVQEVTILLQREAGAWHAIASRLCSGSWPSLDGRRRRVETECKWAGMDNLVAELRAPAAGLRPATSGRSYI